MLGDADAVMAAGRTVRSGRAAQYGGHARPSRSTDMKATLHRLAGNVGVDDHENAHLNTLSLISAVLLFCTALLWAWSYLADPHKSYLSFSRRPPPCGVGSGFMLLQ